MRVDTPIVNAGVGPRRWWRLAASATAAALVGAVAAGALIGLGHLLPVALPTGLSGARSLLAAMLGAVVTVAVFTFWMRAVMVQMMSSEFSPRIVSSFLEDAFQWWLTLAVTAGVSYLLVALLGLPAAGSVSPYGLALIGSTGVTLVAVVMILVAVVDAVERLSPSKLVRQLADRAMQVVERERSLLPDDATSTPEARSAHGWTLTAPEMGWVTAIDRASLFERLLPGEVIQLAVRVGDFVTVRSVLAHTTSELLDADALGAAVAISPTRSSEHDLAFALQQLVDVVTHVLERSGDISTAQEALWHLYAVLGQIIDGGLPTGDLVGADGTAVLATADWDAADHCKVVFERVRSSVARDPIVTRQLLDHMGRLRRLARDAGQPSVSAEIAHQADRFVQIFAAGDPMPAQRREIEQLAARLDLSEAHPDAARAGTDEARTES